MDIINFKQVETNSVGGPCPDGNCETCGMCDGNSGVDAILKIGSSLLKSYCLATRQMPIDKLMDRPGLNPDYISITKADHKRFYDIFRTMDPSIGYLQRGWAEYFFTLMLFWLKFTSTVLKLEPKIDHILPPPGDKQGAFNRIQKLPRPAIKNDDCLGYFALVFEYLFLSCRDYLGDIVPELLDPGLNGLTESDRAFMLPFSLITINFITEQLVLCKVLDTKKINEWYSSLPAEATIDQILVSAKQYFGVA
jgi:hypothetical protein